MLEEKCIFCKIIRNEIKSYKIFEDDATIAFLDRFPITYGHTLVIPKVHIGRIEELNYIELNSLFFTVQKMVNPILLAVNSTASTIGINNGQDAGQVIPHIHVHIIPRSKEDNGGNIHSIMNKHLTLDDKTMMNITEKINSSFKNQGVL